MPLCVQKSVNQWNFDATSEQSFWYPETIQFVRMAYAKALQASPPSPLEQVQMSETLTIHGVTHATKESIV